MKKNYKILEIILFLVIGYLIGLFLFQSLYTTEIIEKSFLFASISILASLIIFTISSNQTSKIERTSNEISEITNKLDDALLGQAKDFKMLFKRMVEIIESVNSSKSPKTKMTLILPIISFGYFNKGVEDYYTKYKKELIELCKSNKNVELIFTHPFKDKIVDFFTTIIDKSNKIDTYENSYKKNIQQLVSFFKEIINSRGSEHENVTINFIDDIFLSGIISDTGKCSYQSLYFFIGTELMGCNNANISLRKEEYISESVYSRTPESYALLNDLINLQKSKSTTLNLFSEISPDLMYLVLQGIEDYLNSEKGDTKNIIQEALQIALDDFTKYTTDLSYDYINNENSHSHFYTKKNNTENNILILPSAAGLYSHLNLGENRNQIRFKIYHDLMSQFKNYNSYLFSFSGQGLIDDGMYSVQQGVNDLNELNNYFNNKNIQIHTIFCICVSSQIYFTFSKQYPKSILNNIPLIIWDLADEVGWKHYSWFQKSFSHIKINTANLLSTLEPINTKMPTKMNNNILFCYPSEQNKFNKTKKYTGLITRISREGFNITKFAYNKLKHIPNIEDDKIEFELLIETINNLKTTK